MPENGNTPKVEELELCLADVKICGLYSQDVVKIADLIVTLTGNHGDMHTAIGKIGKIPLTTTTSVLIDVASSNVKSIGFDLVILAKYEDKVEKVNFLQFCENWKKALPLFAEIAKILNIGWKDEKPASSNPPVDKPKTAKEVLSLVEKRRQEEAAKK